MIKSDELVSMVVAAAEDKKAMRVVALDLQGLSLVADYFVVCHGNTETQVQAIVDAIRKKAEEQGVPIRSIEGLEAARWVLIDLGDVVVHVFHRDEREYYNIERIWSDAKVVEPV